MMIEMKRREWTMTNRGPHPGCKRAKDAGVRLDVPWSALTDVERRFLTYAA